MIRNPTTRADIRHLVAPAAILSLASAFLACATVAIWALDEGGSAFFQERIRSVEVALLHLVDLGTGLMVEVGFVGGGGGRSETGEEGEDGEGTHRDG